MIPLHHNTANGCYERSFVKKPATALVVDHDRTARRMICSVLVKRGYVVVEAENGVEALLKCDNSPIDLVVSDLVMPHLSGRELVERMRRDHPAIKILLTSRYEQLTTSVQSAIIVREDIQVATDVLRKPFSVGSLDRRIREILDC